MKAKSINFGNETCVFFECKEGITLEQEQKQVDFIILDEQLQIIIQENGQDKKTIPLKVDTEEKIQLVRLLKTYKDQSILRIDSVEKKGILITAFILPHVIRFENDEKFVVNLDIAVDASLKKLNVKESTKAFFENHFVLEGKCFAIISEKDSSHITLIGDEYYCALYKTKQNYINAINITKRRVNQRVNGEVTLLVGNISFTDDLTQDVQLSKQTRQKYEEHLKDHGALLKVWEIYNTLEFQEVEQEVNEMGYIKYKKYEVVSNNEGADKIIFRLEKRVQSDFLGAKWGYAVVDEVGLNKEEASKSQRSMHIGDRMTIINEGKDVAIIANNEMVQLPEQGYIIGSCQGSKIMKERRENAQRNIEEFKTPLHNLKYILQGSEIQDIHIKEKRAINDRLLKKIFGTKQIHFTETQKEAIKVAINTPDIAIIQGPPGTGKTTIIKAIVARLEELYKSNIKILISSAQHDAVDNVISEMECGGLPTNRLGGKFGADTSSSNEYIWKWLDTVNVKCDTYLREEKASNERVLMRKVYLSMEICKRNKENKECIKEELEHIYKVLCEMNASEQLLKEVVDLIQETSTKQSEKSSDDTIEFLTQLENLIDGQRLDVSSFLDDGPRQIAKLMSFIKMNSSQLKFEIPSSWRVLRMIEVEVEGEEKLSKLLSAYEKELEQLRQISCISREEVVEETIHNTSMNKVFKHIEKYLNKLYEDSQGKLTDIVWDFKDQLNSLTNIRDIIAKYTKVNAATCQQAAAKRYNGLDQGKKQQYDYVIIDEAARANPLDLLIPMSMGKRIILVGDHKQLPHLLEKNIVEKVIERDDKPELKEVLEQSLFARLYDNMNKEKDRSIKRTVMLKEQYRMHPLIGEVVSQFYDEPLKAGVTAEEKKLELGLYNDRPIAWINVPRSMGGENHQKEQSKYRLAEVERIMTELYKILKANTEYTIGIITFYKKQASLIQDEIYKLPLQDQKRISVGTVDAFQGKEFDIAILSTVRCNTYKEMSKRVGFLDSANRLCVAFSRGKRLLLVIGDYETVGREGMNTYVKPLEKFYQVCRSEGYCE